MKFKTTDENGKGITIDIDIPDGMWVRVVKPFTSLTSHPKDKRWGINQEGRKDARLRPHTQVVRHIRRVIGVSEDEVTVHRSGGRHNRESHSWSNHENIVIVSPKPFAVVCIADDQQYPSQSGYRRESVDVARQVHKGELSRHFVPFKPTLFDSDHKAEGRKIRFVDARKVADQLEVDILEMLQIYAKVSPSSYYRPNAAVWINGHQIERFKLSGGLRARFYLGISQDTTDCWGAQMWGGDCAMDWIYIKSAIRDDKPLYIPERWSKDILTLHHFGFIPDVCEQPEKSFDLETECPEPYTVEGMLPVLPIDEIRELRGSRNMRADITREQFERAVNGTIAKLRPVDKNKEWMPSAFMADRGSHTYYDDFKVMYLFGGRLSIATNFWTRGGHGKGEYWAGFIAVHPEMVTDPRRTEGLYKLMIWPNEILRATPTGAKDGFFPEIEGVDPEIMEFIRAIMKPWNFREVRD